ncbi:DNA methyltransferase [Streptomyces sp. NPDC046862]|uniref:DNA-methyltransferase n=1 Tax=Streptomyces sp. NPDC046862 TaxID=3154603 RepID=UPI003455F46F
MTEPAALDLHLAPPPGGQILHHTDRATIIWGDCRDPEVIAQVPPAYGLLCTDPPYGVAYESGFGRNFTQITGDDGTVDWPAVLAEWIGPEGTISRGSKARGLANARHVYVFGYTDEQLVEPLRLGAGIELIWDKCMTGMGDLSLPWGPGHERITFGVHIKYRSNRDRGAGQLSARLRKGSVLRYPRPNSSSALRHPNEKPVPLVADLIESSTVRGDLVVDPCAGSGSTGVAAVLSGRHCFLVEYEREFAELCVERVRAAEALAERIAAA